MRGGSVGASVMIATPFSCRSAQTEEGKNGHDYHDETNKIDVAVHDVLHKGDNFRQLVRSDNEVSAANAAAMDFA